MKHFFAGALAVSALLYAAAELTLRRPPDDGVIRIRWATDPNPARNLQVEIFGKMQVRLTEEDILDWPAFCTALRGAARRAPAGQAVPQRLWERLDPNGQRDVEALASAPARADRRRAVLAGLNALMDDPGLFARADLAGLELSRDAKLLLARTSKDRGIVEIILDWLRGQAPEELTKIEVVALNRRILEAALRGVIRPARRIEASVESGAAEKLIVQCATGTGPDVIDVYGMAHMMTLVEAGVLVDLTPYAAKGGFGPGNTYPPMAGSLVVDGKQYRYPCNVGANCVIYNPDVFDDHGVPYPAAGWTYEEFIRLSKRIVAGPGKSGRRHLAVANFSNMWMFNDLLIGHGGRYFTPDGLRSRLDSPESIAALRLYHDMMHVHRVIPTPAEAAAMSSQGGWGSGAISWFSNGQAAMIFIGRWYLCQAPLYANLRKAPKDPNSDLKLRTVRLPRPAGRASSGFCGTRAAGINITSPHPNAALKFIQYLASREYGQVIVHDGDALPPNPALARTGRDLVNACAQDPNFHQPFIDALPPARPLDFSGFIDAGQVDRWVSEIISKVENRLVTPEDGLRALAGEINQRIRRNLERRSDLQRKFEKVTGRKWTADWHRQEPAKPMAPARRR